MPRLEKSKRIASMEEVHGENFTLDDVGKFKWVPLGLYRADGFDKWIKIEVEMVIVAPRMSCTIYSDATGRYVKGARAVKEFMKGAVKKEWKIKS